MKCQTYWTESTSGGHVLGVSDQVEQVNLLHGRLTGGQPPRIGEDLNRKLTCL